TPQTPPKPKYPPEVHAVVDEGEKAHAELTRLYASIPNLSVKHRIQELIDVSDKIIADAVADPSDVPQIKKFLDYYLPTTIKLLNSYERMGAQGIEGANITKTMNSIEGMLDTAIDAYKKLLDSLFANQAMDIETDIQVMNTLLKREGFAGGSAFQTMGQ
ncbi:MAG: 5-bromo-4-chloroindolyl phosphate hydrolysis family protein, partial [Oscillospiraceae bacterium]|nr:5-bromo-4-chloroindolyl phosphate hydrolysis family protein [Oscillospiraceae bacterium]